MKTVLKEEIMINREFSLAGAKLVQQFQILLQFIKTELQPVFRPENPEEGENGGFLKSVFQQILSFGKNDEIENSEQQKKKLIEDKLLISNFKTMLKKFERMIRVFEMTYLDLKQDLQDQIKENNLMSRPVEIRQQLEINREGQIITNEK